MTHGHELRWGNAGWKRVQGRGGQRRAKSGTTVMAQSIKYTKKTTKRMRKVCTEFTTGS